MGINGLWTVLKPVAEIINLREFTTVEGVQRNLHGNRRIYIGIDARYIYLHLA